MFFPINPTASSAYVHAVNSPVIYSPSNHALIAGRSSIVHTEREIVVGVDCMLRQIETSHMSSDCMQRAVFTIRNFLSFQICPYLIRLTQCQAQGHRRSWRARAREVTIDGAMARMSEPEWRRSSPRHPTSRYPGMPARPWAPRAGSVCCLRFQVPHERQGSSAIVVHSSARRGRPHCPLRF